MAVEDPPDTAARTLTTRFASRNTGRISTAGMFEIA